MTASALPEGSQLVDDVVDVVASVVVVVVELIVVVDISVVVEASLVDVSVSDSESSLSSQEIAEASPRPSSSPIPSREGALARRWLAPQNGHEDSVDSIKQAQEGQSMSWRIDP